MHRAPTNYLGCKMNRYRLLLSLAIALHLFTLFLFAADVIPQQTKQSHRGWYWFHQGGDEILYHEQMLDLRNLDENLDIEDAKYPWGFPLLMLPFSWVMEPDFANLVQPIAFFWSVIAFPLAILLLADLTWRITQSESTALIAAFLYAALPLLALVGFNLVWNAEMAEVIAIHMTWAQMLSDGPTAFFTLLAAWWYIRTREGDYKSRDVILLGAILGFIGMLRFTGLLIAFVIGGLFLLEKQWKMAVVLVIASLVFFAPQMIYNQVFFGNLFTPGYTALEDLPANGLFNPVYLSDALGKIWDRLGILALIGSVGGIALFAVAIWRIRWIPGLLLGGWLLSYVALYSIYYYSWTGAFMRFMIPALPAVVALGAVLINWPFNRQQAVAEV